MRDVDPRWSLDSLLRNFRPSGSWRNQFAEAYGQALESSTASEQLKGWATAATILGDMHACVLCLFVCYHGLELGSEARERFLGHINLCLMDMGLATPAEAGPVPMKELVKPGAFHLDVEAFEAWLHNQLRPFANNVRRAAEFSVRLTAIRLGLLDGPHEPSIAEILDAALWKRKEPEAKD